jgi:hypothetical protein
LDAENRRQFLGKREFRGHLHGRRSRDGWWRRAQPRDLYHLGHRGLRRIERISSAKDPKRGEEVVEERTCSYSDGIEDSRLNGAIGFEKKKEKIEEKDLKEKSEGGGEIIVFGLSPRGRPSMESPCCVEKEVRPATDNPSQEGSSRGNSMAAWLESKKKTSEGEKSPHEEGVEKGSCTTDEAKAKDSVDLFRKGASSGSGMRMGDLGHGN